MEPPGPATEEPRGATTTHSSKVACGNTPPPAAIRIKHNIYATATEAWHPPQAEATVSHDSYLLAFWILRSWDMLETTISRLENIV